MIGLAEKTDLRRALLSPRLLAALGGPLAAGSIFLAAATPIAAREPAGGSVQVSAMTITNPIAAAAMKYVGQWGGECWPWMRAVVLEATGKTIGFDYREGFWEAGAVEVSEADARQGDIIQFALDSNTAWDADYPGLHTAIVLENLGGGRFTVIDSNSQFDGIVRIRTDFYPKTRAAERGLQYHIYRVSAGANEVLPPTTSAPAVLAPGDSAIVSAGAEGLRLRATPGGTILRVLPDGTRVTVVGMPKVISGRTWVPISTPWGDGWSAAEYLVKVELGAASVSDPRGNLIHRTVITLIASD